MGNWKLEAFKMSIYMMFPVGCFWLFNQPKFFESWMMEKRKILFATEDPKARIELQKVIEQMEMKKQEQLEKQFLEAKKNKKLSGNET